MRQARLTSQVEEFSVYLTCRSLGEAFNNESLQQSDGAILLMTMYRCMCKYSYSFFYRLLMTADSTLQDERN
jgi:hypothetical protein